MGSTTKKSFDGGPYKTAARGEDLGVCDRVDPFDAVGVVTDWRVGLWVSLSGVEYDFIGVWKGNFL